MHDRVWLAKGGQEVGVYLQQKAPTAVRTAAENFRLDLNNICGCRAFLTEKANSAVFLIGILGDDAAIDALTGDTVKDLRDERGELRWESYLVKLLKGGRVVLAGHQRRGAIFAIYELSRLFGVSPWYFFADVPAKKRDALFLQQGFLKTDWPSVQYRGIFLNDEEELNAWAKLHTKDGTIGPETYRHVFELILRLKGNYIWPAMHVNAFNADPENGRLADAMGIVVGTSHCDMLLRSNQHEYDPWGRERAIRGFCMTIPSSKTARAFRNIGGRASNKMLPMR